MAGKWFARGQRGEDNRNLWTAISAGAFTAAVIDTWPSFAQTRLPNAAIR